MKTKTKTKTELFDLYYSNGQAKVMRLCDSSPIAFIDENGNKEYTEAVRHGEKPKGLWDDYVFVGSKEMISD